MDSRTDTLAYGPQSSFYESFRWLEADDDLDLRLGLDDYTQTLNDKPQTANGRQPSFRRHLSITKLPFSRTSMSNASRPGTKDTAVAPSLKSVPSQAPAHQPGAGHVRRRSRALSLISINRQPTTPRDLASPVVDTAATHYQDTGARLKLREYVTSPQKFDEALEYGFPSLGEVDENASAPKENSSTSNNRKDSGRLHTFLEDDYTSSHSTVSDPDSPKTPPVMDRSATPVQSPRPPPAEPAMPSPAPSSTREMTLRMTLTRPDLRAHADGPYGWQHPVAARKSHARGESRVSVLPDKDVEMKESMEKRFAALDQEMLLNTHEDTGVVRRIWKRVRRT